MHRWPVRIDRTRQQAREVRGKEELSSVPALNGSCCYFSLMESPMIRAKMPSATTTMIMIITIFFRA